MCSLAVNQRKEVGPIRIKLTKRPCYDHRARAQIAATGLSKLTPSPSICSQPKLQQQQHHQQQRKQQQPFNTGLAQNLTERLNQKDCEETKTHRTVPNPLSLKTVEKPSPQAQGQVSPPSPVPSANVSEIKNALKQRFSRPRVSDLAEVIVFVDGSFQERTGRAGAGVWFAEGDEHNAHIPVPPPVQINPFSISPGSSTLSSARSPSVLALGSVFSNAVSPISVGSSPSASPPSLTDSPNLSQKSPPSENPTTKSPLTERPSTLLDLKGLSFTSDCAGESLTSTAVRSCSLRAELYAAVAAIHILQTQKNVDIRQTPVLIKQDCVAAIEVLRFVQKLPRAPSRWLSEEPGRGFSVSWSLTLPWGAVLNRDTLLQFQDVLDMWWCLCLQAPTVRFKWIPAHIDRNGNRSQTRYTDAPQNNKFKSSSSLLSTDLLRRTSPSQSQQQAPQHQYRISEEDRVGNAGSDLYARAAVALDPLSSATLCNFAEFPLFPSDGCLSPDHNDARDYLPL